MIGKEIGNYRIVEEIGHGGMGIVYKAIETHLERPVAIKALHPQFSSNSGLVERFRAEARAQAQMNHPNIATLYTFVVQDDIAYMVMEYVDGEAFDRMVQRRGPIPPAEALPAFRQALAGIGYAHRMGILHRDLKPSNIMLNRQGIVKVMDFGLAKVMGDRSLTATGVRLGTVYYMSPEQIMNRPADIRSDIYSLGATLYEILTGNVPFQGDSDYHILDAHVNTPPPLLSGVCPQVPRPVERAVLKALAKSPDERFQSAEEFAAALENAGDSVSPFAVTADPDATHAITRVTVHPAPPAAPAPAGHGGRFAVLIAVALAVLLAGWLLLRPKSRPPAGPAPLSQGATPPAVPQSAQVTPPAAAPATPAPLVIPEGTAISVRLLDRVDASPKYAGADFAAEVSSPVIAGDRVAFRTGDRAVLRLEQADTGGRFKKPDMNLRLISIASGGRQHAVTCSPRLVRGGIVRTKHLSGGTRIDFVLTAPASL
ncbi:MAG TPA: serine/threonine-protein kinase [Bryobacteraceae bacterium]|nr:serine/threonine-protein kinase [Bryobacteraceae bacterium]